MQVCTVRKTGLCTCI